MSKVGAAIFPRSARVVHRQEAVQGALPDPGRQLEALGHGPLEERLGQRDIDVGGLELAGELGRHRVLQGVHGRLELARLLLERGHRRADQHQPVHPLGVGLDHPPGGEAAFRVADHGCLVDPDGVQEGHDIGDQVGDLVAAVGALGVAVAALVEGVGVVGSGQQRQEAAEGEPGVGVAVQEDDRLAVRVALLGVVHLGAAGQAGGREPKLRNLLLYGWPP
jgi:hypothetical protein